MRKWIIAVLLIAPLVASAQKTHLTAQEAKTHVGETQTVCGKVVSARYAAGSKGQPTFLNLDEPYPKELFTILIWGDDRKNVGDLPKVGSHVCAKGDDPGLPGST